MKYSIKIEVFCEITENLRKNENFRHFFENKFWII